MLVLSSTAAYAELAGCKTGTVEQVLVANQEQIKAKPEIFKGLKVTAVTDEATVTKLIDTMIASGGIPQPVDAFKVVKSFLVYELDSKSTYFVFAFDVNQCGVARGEWPKKVLDGVLGRGA